MMIVGDKLNNKEVIPEDKKVKAVREILEPKNITDVRRFLEIVAQLRRLCPQLASCMKPPLLSKENAWL